MEGGNDPLLCPREKKAALETANGVVQLDYLTHLVMKLKIQEVRESHVRELQSIAVESIYGCGGTYRDARTHIRISDSEHVPPEAAFVDTHIREMLEHINNRQRPALERAAYALWKLNWIHPFRGGNGRTSRCIAYLILCIDMGAMLPGLPTLPSLICDRREEYVVALRAADASLRRLSADDDDSEPDLSHLSSYLRDLVIQQLANAVAKLAATIN